MSTQMRAQLVVFNVLPYEDQDGKILSESLSLRAVDSTGTTALLNMQVSDASLFGKFRNGDKFNVEFTPA